MSIPIKQHPHWKEVLGVKYPLDFKDEYIIISVDYLLNWYVSYIGWNKI